MNNSLSINCGGKLLDFEQPRIMGVLNVTPDSFYDGGRYESENTILNQVEKMLDQGADIIDIGGMSSRPGAQLVELQEELERVIKVVKVVKKHFPEAIISIDTVRAQVAYQAAQEGASLINDISAGSLDEKMFETIASLQLPYVLMHMQGKPQNMQAAPSYNDVTTTVLDFLIEKLGKLRTLGIKDVILDPGFGFGKTLAHNYELLQKLEVFHIPECPLLVGASRKSMICKLLSVDPENALNGTTAVHVLALLKGAHLLRVHDVLAARQAIDIVTAYQQPEKL